MARCCLPLAPARPRPVAHSLIALRCAGEAQPSATVPNGARRCSRWSRCAPLVRCRRRPSALARGAFTSRGVARRARAHHAALCRGRLTQHDGPTTGGGAHAGLTERWPSAGPGALPLAHCRRRLGAPFTAPSLAPAVARGAGGIRPITSTAARRVDSTPPAQAACNSLRRRAFAFPRCSRTPHAASSRAQEEALRTLHGGGGLHKRQQRSN